MDIKQIPIGEIKPYEKNAKKHPEKQIKQIADSIQAFGFNQAIVVDKNDVVIVGHGILEAAKMLNLTTVPVLKIDIDEEKAKAYRLADNRLNESDWDMKAVIAELKELSLPMVELTGFSKDLVLEDDDNDDVAPALPKEPRSKLGDVYILGNHRLVCGDSTKPEDVDLLMGGVKADCVFTDPPYNINYKGQGENTSNTILNDKMGVGEFDIFLKKVFDNYKVNIKKCAGFYCFHSTSTQAQFEHALKQSGFTIKNQLVWNKPMAALGWGDYRWKHEPFFYCGITGAEIQFYGDRTHSTVVDVPKDPAKAIKWLEIQREMEKRGLTTIWSMKRDNVQEYVHPCLPAGEMVRVNDEWIPIEKVKIGDKTKYGTVIETTSHEADEIVTITLEDGAITNATGNHPFLVERDGNIYWIESRLIRDTDNLLTRVYDTGILKPLCQEEKMDCHHSDSSLKKDTAECMTNVSAESGWNTTSYGKTNMDQSQKDSKFTTGMDKNSTMLLRILNLSIPLHTSGITLVQENSRVEFGKSNVKIVENGNQSIKNTGITAEDISQEKHAKDVGVNEASKLAKFLLRKVGSVKTTKEKTQVFNITIDGVPAFDTLIGVSHNTQKPVELICYALANSTKEGDIVMDLFGGSGSTLIACEKAGRTGYLMELDPKYVDVIVQRFVDYTENDNIIKNGEETLWNSIE